MKLVGNGRDSKCVARAVSTIRMLLGYRTALPRNFPSPEYMSTRNIARNVLSWFPKHTVNFWCDKEPGMGIKGWQGSWMPPDAITENHVMMFDYYLDGSSDSHMVVGSPAFYGDMTTSMIVRVSLKRRNA